MLHICLESCRAWQETFFYVKNTGTADFINLPAYVPELPSRANWRHNTGNTHIETNRIVWFMEQLNRDTGICSDDIIHRLFRVGFFLYNAEFTRWAR
jgi:hypothetical protein